MLTQQISSLTKAVDFPSVTSVMYRTIGLKGYIRPLTLVG